MAVFDHGYKGFTGPLQPNSSRFLVLTRYAMRDVFASRIFLLFFAACFIWPLICSVFIYLHYNLEALAAFQLEIFDLIKIDTFFFHNMFLLPQSLAAFALTLVVGPALISPDLRNNAMPLILSRPVNRVDYALGKWTVLAILLSAVTWIPGLLLFGFQAYLAGPEWLSQYARIAPALFVGSWVWILVLSLFALAVSAWVKWKPFARIVFLGAFFVASAMSNVFNLLYGSWIGSVLNPFELISVIWHQLFGTDPGVDLPVAVAWVAFMLFWAFSATLLFRRIRAYEVVS